eukprot:SAG31_NODE_4905_length_2875_cov_2.277017_7_plen_90_part_00
MFLVSHILTRILERLPRLLKLRFVVDRGSAVGSNRAFATATARTPRPARPAALLRDGAGQHSVGTAVGCRREGGICQSRLRGEIKIRSR